MKIGILVTTYNRPEYLKRCLESLTMAKMPEDAIIYLIDDSSNDPNTLRLISTYQHPECKTKYAVSGNRGGIKQSLKLGCQELFEADKCDIVINIDGDALVRNDFINVLILLHEQFPENLITGFNCNTLNANGSVRHQIEDKGQFYDVSRNTVSGWNKKKTVGGINLLFTRKMYDEWILPAIMEPMGNWDQMACLNAGNGVICAVPSVIQHIGIQSSMGHSGPGSEAPDMADDFKPLHLPNVTLIGVDTKMERLEAAFKKSQENILFGDMVMITDVDIRSKEHYSLYCIRELYKHVKTEYMLIIQWDGYVLNYKAWNPEWLKYDYIGAPWEWYADGMQVGNGGFSLRSRRLMEVCAHESCFDKVFHPEDDAICRKRRRWLETEHTIKFAPVELARQFSIEGYNTTNRTWTDQFGFHSTAVDIAGPKETNVAVMLQFFGIGDIIFSVGIAMKLINDGYKVIWPVKGEYVEGLNKAYPEIAFVDFKRFGVNYEQRTDAVWEGMRLIPLRWTYDTMKVPFKDCMRSKYDYMGMDWETWRETTFTRNLEKEFQLFRELGLVEGEPYTLVNEIFCTDGTGRRTMPQTHGKRVTMTIKSGYSIFDWAKVIEQATEIHTVSTSIIYLLELLSLRAEKVHIYIRRPNERNHENYQYIMTRHAEKYIFETP